MQRRVVLVRHAKTQQGFPDVERALTERGRRDAAEIGRWLSAHEVVPDLVVVSPAVRARQTWELAAAELPTLPPTKIDDRIYENTVEDLLGVIRDTDDEIETLALVGHNPSMEQLADQDFPTGSIAVFPVSASWSNAELDDMTTLATCRG